MVLKMADNLIVWKMKKNLTAWKIKTNLTAWKIKDNLTAEKIEDNSIVLKMEDNSTYGKMEDNLTAALSWMFMLGLWPHIPFLIFESNKECLPLATSTTMNSRRICHDRNLCLGKPAYLPNLAKRPFVEQPLALARSAYNNLHRFPIF